MKLCVLIVMAAALSACSTSKNNAAGPDTTFFDTQSVTTCSLNQDSRKLELQNKKSSSCSLLYTKFGSQQIVAESNDDSLYCKKVKSKITGFLVRSGYTCE